MKFDTIGQVTIRILCVLLISVLFICGCEGAQEIPSEITVSGTSDGSGRSAFPAECCGVTLESAVETAVSLSPAVTEIICEIGFESRLVGVSNYCDYPESLSLPTFGSTENPDLDGIIALSPDAVFTLSLLSERESYRLTQAGIAVLTLTVPTNLEEYADLYCEIASAFYGNELGDTLKDETKALEIAQSARSALEKAADGVELEEFVYVTEKLTLAGADTFESAVLSIAGENLCEAEGYVSAEALRPDYIVASDKLTVADLRSDSAINSMISNGALVIFVDSAKFERPTARTAEIFAQISE